MINWSRKWFIGLFLFSLLGGPALAEVKIATVDTKKIFELYWKKKQAEASLKERGMDMEREMKNMLEDYKKAKEDYSTLMSTASDQAASPEERERRKKEAEVKLKRLRDLEETIDQYRRQSSMTLDEQGKRMTSNIIKEIQAVVSAKAKAAGFTMVLDTAAEALTRAPVVLYTNNENDMTDAVLLQLNSTAPGDASKSEETTLDKSDGKKKDAKK